MSIHSVLADVVAQSPDAGPGALTADRLWSLAGALLSLAGAVAGGLALDVEAPGLDLRRDPVRPRLEQVGAEHQA
ncbi:hypothetical protein AB0J53_16985, partial [Nonomuraea sp. NPDC049725]